MAVFQSKYRELAFYVDGRKHKFSNGEFTTDDEKVIAVLTKVRDAVRVDEPAQEPAKDEDKPEVKDAAKPAAKAASKPKASAK